MTQPAPGDDVVSRYDDRPFGVALDRGQLLVGDRCNVTVEAQMMGLPTGALITFKNVVYRGEEYGRLRFDSELEPHRFTEAEIVRVALFAEPAG